MNLHTMARQILLLNFCLVARTIFLERRFSLRKAALVLS